MIIKKIGCILFLIILPLMNLFAQSDTTKQIKSEDSDKVIEDSTNNFFDFEMFANIGTFIDGDNEQKGIPIGFSMGIHLGRDYYLYPEYKIKINGFALILLKNIYDGEMVISIGRLYGKNKFKIFPKIGLTAFYKSDFVLFYGLLFNFGVDFRYRMNEYSNLFCGLVLTATPNSESKFIGKILKIGFSTNL